ncbi:hypothetical protein [Intestinibacillus massiliensis]|uniref:hypothetical protein n=1 Tax=Intestinibacillus massiliensis TaxID=1871029 RepID=UPI00117BB7DD|nr:hypothetical protein [Intestinibacillus massiliensis]
MLRAAIKFCGGCNPRYDRGARYADFQQRLAPSVTFELPREGVHYDFLLIITGCHACHYEYEEIEAERRFYCTAYEDFEPIIREIEQLIHLREETDK